jgi:PEGA domain
MRIAITLVLLAALGSPAHADGDLGVIVTGEGSMRPQLQAQLEGWLSQHGHTLVPSPLPPQAIAALADCFVRQDRGCARNIVEQRAKSTSMVYARIDIRNNKSNGTHDVTLTAYWFNKGHDAVTQSETCDRCTDQSLRTTADEIMKKLVGGDEVGHIKFKSVPPGARITIDGQPIGVTPLDWDLPSGKHMVRMDKAGLEPESRELLVVSNRTDLFAMKLALSARNDRSDDHDDKPHPRTIPLGMLAAGGLLLGTGIVMFAIDEDPGLNRNKTYHNTAPAGFGLAIGGAMVSGLGAGWLLFRSSKAHSTPIAAVTSDSAYIGWLGRF